jgi:hypothetical protein
MPNMPPEQALHVLDSLTQPGVLCRMSRMDAYHIQNALVALDEFVKQVRVAEEVPKKKTP